MVAAFNVTLRLCMAGSAMDLVDLVFLHPFAEVGGDITRAIVKSRRGRFSTLTLCSLRRQAPDGAWALIRGSGAIILPVRPL